ncbi:MAG: TIGR02147 family protein [Fibrobacterales bacterium]
MTGFSIYNYWSSIDFLNDWFIQEKIKNSKFSFQYFANKAGFKSRSFIANVLAGRSKLSTDSLLKIAKAMNLSKRETHYLEALINYDATKDDNQKEYYRDQLLYLKPVKEAYNLERAHTQYLDNWYTTAIREAVAFLPFNDDFKRLGSYMKPAITAKQAKDTVHLLLELKLITRHETKRGIIYRQTEYHLDTPSHLPKSLAVRNHQRKVIHLGAEAIERFHKDERNIRCATFSLNQQGIDSINKLVSEFQNKLVKIASDFEENADSVYQANIQFFPLTKIKYTE